MSLIGRSPDRAAPLHNISEKQTRSRTRAIYSCDFCLKEVNNSETMTCTCCSKIFHLECILMSQDQKRYISARNIKWICQACYFGNISSTSTSIINLAAAVKTIEDGFNTFKCEIALYNQLNDDNISILRETTAKNCNNIDALTSEIETLKLATNEKINNAHYDINDLVKKFASLEKKLSAFDGKIKENPNAKLLADMETKIDNVDRFLLSKNLILNNVPEEKDEVVSDIVNKLIVTLGLTNICVNDYVCYRMGQGKDVNKARTSHPPPIIIKFNNKRIRDDVFSIYIENIKAKNFPSLLTLGISTSPARIYINEHLTGKMFKIFSAARQYKQEKYDRFHQVFTAQGYVYIRMTATSKRKCILSLSQLHTLLKMNAAEASCSK